MSASSLPRPSRRHAALFGFACLALSAPAQAAPSDLFAPETASALVDLRLTAADGEGSWTDGGFGKARFGGDADENLRVRPIPAEADIIWQPRFAWDLAGTVSVAAQQGQADPVDLIEAFVTWKPVPRGATRFSARAGLFWPPVSLEHEGAAWSVADMVTPSAINSWIGEEVKVAGVEATAAHEGQGGRIAATLAIFGLNDTAGTLLAFRGWAMHDVKAGAFGHQRLPPLNAFLTGGVQAPTTRPAIEIDNRPGFYAKLSWRPAEAPLLLEAFYYRNGGDPEAVTPRLQWGWDTQFWNVAARLDLSENTRIIAQALTGSTEMGYEEAGHYWVETRFRSAFLRFSTDRGPVTLSGRVDLFGTREHGSEMGSVESEDGWALTGAAAWTLSHKAKLIVEALHTASDRGSRVRVGEDPRQTQTVFQTSLRLTL